MRGQQIAASPAERRWFSLRGYPRAFSKLRSSKRASKMSFSNGVSTSIRISFNQADWKGCPREAEEDFANDEGRETRMKEGERECTIVFHAVELGRTPLSLFPGPGRNVERNYTSAASAMPARKNWSADREERTIPRRRMDGLKGNLERCHWSMVSDVGLISPSENPT